MELERMNGRVVVESGMGQLQVAVAGLGEGGLWQGMRAGQGTWYPGTWASGHADTLWCCTYKRGRKPPPLSQWASKLPTLGGGLVPLCRCGWHGCAGGLQNWGNLKARTVLWALTAPCVWSG